MSDGALVKAFRIGIEMRRDMLADGASRAEADEALERVLRANLPVLDERDWPHWARVPRCLHCDGTGLRMRPIVDRMGIHTREGVPCSCQAGVRFLPKTPAEQEAQSFAEAGKTKKKAGGFRRWDG